VWERLCIAEPSWYQLFLFPSLAPENMYVYEGRDYSKSSDADKKTFDQLLTGNLKMNELQWPL